MTSSFIIFFTMVVFPALSSPLGRSAHIHHPHNPSPLKEAGDTYSIKMRISLSFNRAFLSIESILVVFLSDGSFWCPGEGVVKVRFWAVRMVEYQSVLLYGSYQDIRITAMINTMDADDGYKWSLIYVDFLFLFSSFFFYIKHNRSI